MDLYRGNSRSSELTSHCERGFSVRPCSHNSFGTGTGPERNRAPVFPPVPLCPVVPERADHLAMWSQWNGSGTGPVGSVVWTRDWTRSGTVPVARDIRRFPAHSSYLQTFITSWHLATDRLIADKSRYSDWSGYVSWSNMRKMPDCPNFGRSGHSKSSCANDVVCSSPIYSTISRGTTDIVSSS